MGYQPKHQKQLDGSATAGEDCWARTSSMAVDFETRGYKVPTMEEIRNRAGVQTGGANTAACEKAVESYNTPTETGDREPCKYGRHPSNPWDDEVRDALNNENKCVTMSIDYGYLNEHKPNLSGDKNFNGDHSVLFCGHRLNSEGKTEVKCFDPLYDGRRSDIPNGPQWWPIWLAKECAAAFAGEGLWTGGICPTSWPLE